MCKHIFMKIISRSVNVHKNAGGVTCLLQTAEIIQNITLELDRFRKPWNAI